MNLIRRFLLFFILTSLIPSLILGTFLYEESHTKLNERFANLLSTAQLLISERLEDDLDKLELVNNQATFLSINDEFQAYLQKGQRGKLEATLNRFQEIRNLSIVALMNANNKVVASTDTFEDASRSSLDGLIQIAATGQSVNSIERLKFSEDSKSSLMYVAVSPIFSEAKPKKLLGTLLIGQSLRENNSFSKLLQALPILKVRVLDSPPKKIKVTHTAIKRAKMHLQKHKVNLKVGPQYQEQIEGQKHTTALIPLSNYSGSTVGYLAVSLSQELEESLREKNSALLIIFMLLALIGITVAGYWFNRSFVVPLNAFAEACTKVGEADYKIQLDTKSAKGEIKKTFQNFNRMSKRLQENEEMRATFISTLTHDLRTPLLAQKRVFDLMQDDENANLQFIKLVGGLNTNNEHLLSMVELLVQTYQLEAGQINLEKQNTNLHELVQECQSNLEPLIESKGIEFNNLIAKSLWAYVDPFQLKRVLMNLIGNAIENLPNDRKIEVLGQELKDHFKIKIWDNGTGIPAEALPLIFERYYSRTRTKQKIGSGLGLYICKMIVEAHEGTISVESEIDSHTCFTINLPKQHESIN
jgi:signal transduction histidine kinase